MIPPPPLPHQACFLVGIGAPPPPRAFSLVGAPAPPPPAPCACSFDGIGTTPYATLSIRAERNSVIAVVNQVCGQGSGEGAPKAAHTARRGEQTGTIDCNLRLLLLLWLLLLLLLLLLLSLPLLSVLLLVMVVLPVLPLLKLLLLILSLSSWLLLFPPLLLRVGICCKFVVVVGSEVGDGPSMTDIQSHRITAR